MKFTIGKAVYGKNIEIIGFKKSLELMQCFGIGKLIRRRVPQPQAQAERPLWSNPIANFQGHGSDGIKVLFPGFSGMNIEAIGQI